MKPLFRNITIYNKKNYDQFVEFHRKKYNLSYNLYTLIMSLLLLYCIVFNIQQQSFKLLTLFLVLLIVWIVVRVYIPVKRYQKNKTKFSKNQSASFTFDFYKYYFTIGKKTIYYFKLYKVFETEEYFYLYINEDFAALVNKKGFKVGNANDFSDFIKKKCLFKYSKQK